MDMITRLFSTPKYTTNPSTLSTKKAVGLQ